MNQADVLSRLQAIWDRVGLLLLEAAAADAGARPWVRAYLDVRGAPTGGSRLEKWRVELAGGEVLRELDVPRGVGYPILQAYDLRDEAFTGPDKWYGVLVTVYPDRRCEVTFDYDPLCVQKDFFKS